MAGKTVEGFLRVVPPTVTHNDLVARSGRGGRPTIRKSERLRDAEGLLVGLLAPYGPDSGPLSGPLALTVRWCFPKGLKRPTGPHTQKPDLSNMLKTLEDCMQVAGIIADDRLICEEHLYKAWSDPCGIFFSVSEVVI